ncbi:hypothetical protein [Sorangium sp. So ce385]|uniref:hypothetical protein n=1 Tax=Sorangium sp. So ce385 TaxID=3133308 RepID=UPI003F5CAA7F
MKSISIVTRIMTLGGLGLVVAACAVDHAGEGPADSSAAEESAATVAPRDAAAKEQLDIALAESGLTEAELIDYAIRAEAERSCDDARSIVEEIHSDGAQRVRKALPLGEAAVATSAAAGPCQATCTICGGDCLFDGVVKKAGKVVWDGASCWCQGTIYPWDYWNSCAPSCP